MKTYNMSWFVQLWNISFSFYRSCDICSSLSLCSVCACALLCISVSLSLTLLTSLTNRGRREETSKDSPRENAQKATLTYPTHTVGVAHCSDNPTYAHTRLVLHVNTSAYVSVATTMVTKTTIIRIYV